jgi:hypothetical protein
MLPALTSQFERVCTLVSTPERKRNQVLIKFEKKFRAITERLKEMNRERELRAYNSEGKPFCIR